MPSSVPARIAGMPFEELEALMAELGQPAYRARQTAAWVHRRGASSFDSMTDLPANLRELLSERAELARPGLRESRRSRDGSVKLLLQLDDGELIEAVAIPDGDGRLTACISVQAGCPCGCVFCMTGRTGYRRNLDSAEMIHQVSAAAAAVGRPVTNVVFMGMGEPLLNLDEVTRALSVITDRRCIGIGSRHVTVSTVGIPPAIDRLSGFGGQVGLALSLHSAVEQTRRRLVPYSRRWSLAEIRESLVRYSCAVNRPVTLEYCLIGGVNDNRAEADALAAFARKLRAKINLIGCNRVQGLPWRSPSLRVMMAFRDWVAESCPVVTLRASRGSDISAVCGQLGAWSMSGPPPPEPTQNTGANTGARGKFVK